MPYMLGLDVGTSGAKAVVVADDGRVIATATEEYPLSTPQPLWSEQDPADWWRGSQAALRRVVAESGVAAEIVGLGLTGQMHGAVFLDERDAVIRPALLWNDGRTQAQCHEITAHVGAERLIAIAGNPALTGFQAPKVLWLREHEPEHYARVRRLLLPKDYIRLRMTGEHASDASDAAGTLLLDLQQRDWSGTILDALEIPRDWLPRVYEGPDVTGRLRADVAEALGLTAGLPVVAGGGDNAAAAIGTGIIREGAISASIGTSGVLFAHSDTIRLDPQGRLHSFCHAVPGAYHLMAVTLSAGGSLQWMRNTLRAVAPDLGYDRLVALAQQTPPGAEGLLFLPYLSGERTPHRDPLARGAFVGLTQRHTLGHMARAVMEGVVFSLRDGQTIMAELGLPLGEVRAIGGGARSTVWRQMQADMLGTPIVTMRAEEGPAFGAALLAGVGAGLYPDVLSAVEAAVATGEIIRPQPEVLHTYDELYALYRQLYGALKPTFSALAQAG
ncbi:MAG TPA: xylulokinase [Herpetosiphonaceae bacterium]